jgi:hypothetical protein
LHNQPDATHITAPVERKPAAKITKNNAIAMTFSKRRFSFSELPLVGMRSVYALPSQFKLDQLKISVLSHPHPFTYTRTGRVYHGRLILSFRRF